MSETDFEAAVNDALDRIPPDLARTMNNVAIFIEDDYTPSPARIRTPCCWDSTRASR